MSETVFATPLDARSLVEASAGTGKTYALAGLFARAVIVGRLRVPQVLAVTYTVAATQELQARVRRRLQHAAALALAWREADPAQRDGDDAETAMLRRLLHEALHGDAPEPLAALRLRLERAAREMDLAAITTIHGFCQRLLAEHALAAGEPLLAADLQPANAAWRSALAVDLWREAARDAAGADFLQRRFGDIEGLAAALQHLLAPEPLLPPAPPDDAAVARDRAWASLRACFAEEGPGSRAALAAAIDGKVLSSARDKRVPLAALWDWLARQGESAPVQPHPELTRLTRSWLQSACLKGKQDRLPQLPLCTAVERYLVAEEACDLQRLHALRAAAHARDAAGKRAFHRRDYDDLIATVHAATQDPRVAPELARTLRAQYPLVLVDEFQDTDARQWAIFERLFGEGGLLLVGDPKQAIYRFRGGDVETYLRARAGARQAQPLRQNFRSRPCVLSAVNALFADCAGEPLGAGIAFAASEPGGKAADDDFQRAGVAAPALVFHRVPARPDGKEWTKPEATRIAAQLCARAIRDLLRDAREGRAMRRERGVLRPVQPRDCAVLVREHREAVAVRRALAALGVPAVSAGRQSLFASEQAQSLLVLLLALAAPADERRLRAALATPLFGFDAPALEALADDGEVLRRWQNDVMHWRLQWEQHGPQPMLADVAARQASRLLAMADGERQLTHLLHLAELLQEAASRQLGPQGQLDWLRAAMAHPDADDETQWPRLESDAGRVRILTLHASKGLEFPLVFLPFAGIGRGNGGPGKARWLDYHDDAGTRVRQWRTDWTHGGAPAWDDAAARARDEERAEDMRLLYVGLTRAVDALWVCGGALAAQANSALQRLLGGAQPSVPPGSLEIHVGVPDPDDEGRLPPEVAAEVPDVRIPQRRLRRDWWIHSFSQWHRQRPHGAPALVPETAAGDERPLAGQEGGAVRFGGTRFGNALHHALEHADFGSWRDADGSRVPDGQEPVLRAALQALDYPAEQHADGMRELAPLVARTLNVPLPTRDGEPPVRLCDLPPEARVAELEFHFALADADAGALLALLHAHGIALARRDFGAWPRLAGLMTGLVDLTYVVANRVYVLDYKSNRLPAYDAATLGHAMAASEYDLQALLYVVAVHRWLRMRRGARYDYARDFGGVRYVFCRGLVADDPAQGIACPRFDAALVDAVDRLLSPGGDTA